MPVRGRGHGVRRLGQAVVRPVDDRLLVDGVGDGLTDPDVLQRRVAVTDATGAGVHGQLVEAALLALHDLDVRVLLEALDAARGDVVGGVDLALFQRGDHGVGVGEHPEDDPVDRRLAAPVVGVGLHGPVLAPAQLGQGVGAGADAVGRLVGPELVGGDVLVDVLGDDVDVHGGQLGVRHRRGDLEGHVVDGRGVEVLGRGEVVEPLLVPGPVDRVGDVLGGEGLTVGPLEAFAEVVGVGEAVVGGLPRLGQAGDGLEVVGRLVGQRGVLEVPDLVGRDRVAHGDVGRVDLLGEPDGEGQLLLVAR